MYDNKHLLSIMWSLIEILMVLKIEIYSVPKRMDLFSFAKKIELPVCSTKSCIYIIVPYDKTHTLTMTADAVGAMPLHSPSYKA